MITWPKVVSGSGREWSNWRTIMEVHEYWIVNWIGNGMWEKERSEFYRKWSCLLQKMGRLSEEQDCWEYLVDNHCMLIYGIRDSLSCNNKEPSKYGGSSKMKVYFLFQLITLRWVEEAVEQPYSMWFPGSQVSPFLLLWYHHGVITICGVEAGPRPCWGSILWEGEKRNYRTNVWKWSSIFHLLASSCLVLSHLKS